MENYQTENGLRIPEPLRRYLPGQPDFLPFTKELPKESIAEKKGKEKQQKNKPKTVVAAAAGAVEEAAEKLKDVTV